MSGLVYIIEAENDLVKIGFSKDPRSRLATLQTGSAGQLRLIATAPATPDQERELHRLLNSSRERGEWFRKTRQVLAAISMMTPCDVVVPPRPILSLVISSLCGGAARASRIPKRVIAWRERNPEEHRERQRAYMRKKREREREK